MTSIFLYFFLILNSYSQIEPSYLQITEDHTVYFEHYPAQKNKPTFFMLNGLVFNLNGWRGLVQELTKQGYGVVLTAYSTQPESLIQLENGVEPHFLNTNLETQDLADEMISLMKTLELKKPHLVGYSYGASVGIQIAESYSDGISSLNLIAPATKSTNRYYAPGAAAHNYFSLMSAWGGDALYNSHIRQIMAPTSSPSAIGDMGYGEKLNPKFASEGIIKQAIATKYFDLSDYTDLDFSNINVFLGDQEEPKMFKDQLNFAEKITAHSSTNTFTLIKGAGHGMVPTNPNIVAGALIKSIKRNTKSTHTVLNVKQPVAVNTCKALL